MLPQGGERKTRPNWTSPILTPQIASIAERTGRFNALAGPRTFNPAAPAMEFGGSQQIGDIPECR